MRCLKGNDIVMTPPALAQAIVRALGPTGRVLDAARGEGAFYNTGAFTDWTEISEGRDFFEWKERTDWVITNPPFSIFRKFLKHAMSVSDNVALLCHVPGLLGQRARNRDVEAAGFAPRLLLVFDAPPPPWPQMGFEWAVCWWQKGWKGPLQIQKLEYK